MSVEFVGIELELRGEEGVYRDLQKIDSLLNSFRGRKKVDAGLGQLKRDIVAARGEIEKYQRLQDRIARRVAKYGEDGLSAKAFEKNAEKIKEAKYQLKDYLQIQREATLAERQMGDTFSQTFKKMTSRIAHAGSAMQSLGNGLVRITSPFERITSGLIYGAGYKALNMLTSGFSGAFERYDTMQNYTKSLKALGLDAEKTFTVGTGKAQTAIENLNEAVLGLPTGLDEIVAAQKIYAGATGEMVKSTKTAIAANNTFLASGTNAREQRFIQRYLASLASGAELTTTQWQSMSRIAPLAMRAVAEELGYAGDKYQDFIKDVSNGTIAGEKFLDTFIKVGTEGKVQAAANVMKTTWEGLSANIQNATKRMGEGLLKTLDDVFISYNGRNLVQNLLGFDAKGNEIGGGIKHAINDISQGMQDWVKANPDRIMSFLNTMKNVDWLSIGKGVMQGLGWIASGVERFARIMNGRDLAFIGRWGIKLNVLGKFLLGLGGITKGLRHPLGGIATIIRGTRSFKKRGLLGMLGDLIAGESIYNATEATEKIETVAPKMGRFSTGLSKVFKGWAQVATMVGGSAFVAWGSMKLFKGAFQSIKEIGDIVADTSWDDAGAALVGMGGFITTMISVSKLMGGSGLGMLKNGAILAGLTALFSGAFWADMEMIKRGLKALSESIDYVNEIIDKIHDIKDVGSFSKANLNKAINAFNEITKLFGGEMETTGEGTLYGNYGGANRSTRAKKNPLLMFKQDYADSLKNMNDALGYISDIAKQIKKVNKTKISDDDVATTEEVTNRITNSLAFIGHMVENIPDIFESKSTTKTTSILEQSLADIKTALDHITGKGGLFAEIGKMNKKMTKLINDGAFSTFSENLDTLSTTISEIWTKLNFTGQDEGFNPDKKFGQSGFQGKGGTGQLTNPTQLILEQLKNLAEAMTQVESVIASIKAVNKSLKKVELSDDGTYAFVESIQTMISQLSKAFKSEEILALRVQADLFKASVEALKASLESLGTDGGGINVEIVINPTIKGDTETIKLLKDAHDKIKRERDSIAKLSKDINLKFTITASLPGLDDAVAKMWEGARRLSAARAALDNARSGGGGGVPMGTGGRSTGGMIYRARGGAIPFKRRGTDTVPAMLTPGEYVHNRRAVSFFGQDFMAKINRMDVRGALADLMMKAGSMASQGVGTVINNYNNYDNRNVTINNSGSAGAGFTFKRASRALQAL